MTVKKIDVKNGLKVVVSDIDELVIKCSKKAGKVKVVAPDNVCVKYNEKENILKISEVGKTDVFCSGGKKSGIVAGGNVTIIGGSQIQVGIGSNIIQNQGMSDTSSVIISVPSETKIMIDEDVEITREYDSEDKITVEIDD